MSEAIPDNSVQRSQLGNVLYDSWQNMKRTSLEGGRPLADKDINDLDADGDKIERITYSETVSYFLLMAVLMDDQGSFNKIWGWTKDNLQRKNIGSVYNASGLKQDSTSKNNPDWSPTDVTKKDALFAWQWTPSIGDRGGGVAGENSIDAASDADQDIAAALLMAYVKWNKPDAKGKPSDEAMGYYNNARDILDSIWQNETIEVEKKRVMMGGPSHRYAKDPLTGEPTYAINPSYFRPTYYNGLFAKFDPSHDWGSLTQTSYDLIQMAQRATMHDENQKPVYAAGGLVPDFIAISQKAFQIKDYGWALGDNSRNDFYSGGDAFRTSYWMALQYRMDPKDPEALKYCQCEEKIDKNLSPCSFYKNEIIKNQDKDPNKSRTIYASYFIDGTVRSKVETLQTMSVYMVYLWATGGGDEATTIFDKVMEKYQNTGGWKTRESDMYYGNSWAWLSIALMNGDMQAALKFTDKQVKQAIKLYKPVPGVPGVAASEGPNAKISYYEERIKERPIWLAWQNNSFNYDMKYKYELADNYKWVNRLGDAQDVLTSVIDNKYSSFNTKGPYYHQAMLRLVDVQVTAMGQSNDATPLLPIFINLCDEFKSLGALERPKKSAYALEIMRLMVLFTYTGTPLTYKDNKGNNIDVQAKAGIQINEKTIREYYEYATTKYNWTDKGYGDIFIAVKAHMALAYYLNHIGKTDESDEIYKTALWDIQNATIPAWTDPDSKEPYKDPSIVFSTVPESKDLIKRTEEVWLEINGEIGKKWKVGARTFYRGQEKLPGRIKKKINEVTGKQVYRNDPAYPDDQYRFVTGPMESWVYSKMDGFARLFYNPEKDLADMLDVYKAKIYYILYKKGIGFVRDKEIFNEAKQFKNAYNGLKAKIVKAGGNTEAQRDLIKKIEKDTLYF